jgi:branched-chain amino acid transport system permease protein
MALGYLTTIATIVCIYVILTLSLNIISGYAGQASLGHAAFFGIGAYTSALLTLKLGVNFWLAAPLAMVAAGAVGALVGVISLRIKGDFLAVTTIGINFVIVTVFEYSDFFGGAYGIMGIQYPTLFGLKISKGYYLLMCLGFVGLCVLFSLLVSKSWLGLALEAIRENEEAAEASGINCAKFKVIAFAFGCAWAGLAGVLFAHFMRFITPNDFAFPISITIVSMMVVGGIGTIRGPILGALIMAALPELLRPLANYRLLFYGGLIVLMTRFQPQGLFGDKAFILRMLFGRWGRSPAASPGDGPADGRRGSN